MYIGMCIYNKYRRYTTVFKNYVDGSTILLSRMVNVNMKINEKETKFIEQLFKLNTSTVGIIDWRMHEYFYWKDNESLPGFPDCVINVKDICKIRTEAGINCHEIHISLKDSDDFIIAVSSYKVAEVVVMMLIIKMNYQNNELPKLLSEMNQNKSDDLIGNLTNNTKKEDTDESK